MIFFTKLWMAQFSVSIYIMQSKQYLASIKKYAPLKIDWTHFTTFAKWTKVPPPKTVHAINANDSTKEQLCVWTKKGIRLSYREQQFTYDRRIHIYSRNQRSSHPLSTDLWPLDIVLSRPMTTILHHSVFQTIILHKIQIVAIFRTIYREVVLNSH